MLPEEFHRSAGLLRLRQAIHGRFFSISATREAAELLRVRIDEHNKDWKALHCVNWIDMPPGMEDHVKNILKGIFQLHEVFEVEEVKPQPQSAQQSAVKPSSKVLRLFLKGR